MAENLAIAKVQDEVLAQKMMERQKRLEEQAAQRIPAPLGLTEEDLYQRHVYKKVLEFEQEELWIVELRKRIAENPTNVDVISNLVSSILQFQSHPLTEELLKHQYKILDKISPLVDGKSALIEMIEVPLSEKLMSELLAEVPDISEDPDAVGGTDDVSAKPTEDIPKQSSDACHQTSQGGGDSTDKHQESYDKQTDIEIKKKDEINEDDSLLENTDDTPKPSAVKVETSAKEDDNDPVHDSSSSIQVNEKNKVDITGNNLDDSTSALKHDIEKSLSLCDDEIKKLQIQDRQVKTISKQFTDDYDKYNQDNLDDLFDSEEGDGDESLTGLDNLMTCSVSSSSSLDVGQTRSGTCVGEDISCIVDDSKPDTPDMPGETKAKDVVMMNHSKFKGLDKRIAQLKNAAYQRHVKGIVDDILTSIEKVQVLFVIVFEELATAEGQDQCNVLLEEFFFRPIWPKLLTLFRLANRPKEILLACQMSRMMSAGPTLLGVRAELCLISNLSDGDAGIAPYEPAVQEVQTLIHCHTPLDKLECLVRSSRLVIHCVEQYYKGKQEKTPSIGADDLLPVLCYLIVQSHLPQLVSECHAMDRLIHEGYMIGEEGYCLTSFQTAINFIISEGCKHKLVP